MPLTTQRLILRFFVTCFSVPRKRASLFTKCRASNMFYQWMTWPLRECSSVFSQTKQRGLGTSPERSDGILDENDLSVPVGYNNWLKADRAKICNFYPLSSVAVVSPVQLYFSKEMLSLSSCQKNKFLRSSFLLYPLQSPFQVFCLSHLHWQANVESTWRVSLN